MTDPEQAAGRTSNRASDRSSGRAIVEVGAVEESPVVGRPSTDDPRLRPLFEWCRSRDWEVFDHQVELWLAYLDGSSGLLHAPTGTGKTYAAWGGPLLEALAGGPVPEKTGASRSSGPGMDSSAPAAISPAGRRRSGRIGEPHRVLWITPLRALAADTTEALGRPIADLGLPWTVELRTGDSSQSVKKRQRDRLPTALVTTPESLSLLLSYPGAAGRFGTLRCVVVDEWHELLGSKRGVQTQLCLARLRSIAPAVRTWGLSATLGNLDEALEALLGPVPDDEGAARAAARGDGRSASGRIGTRPGGADDRLVVRGAVPKRLEIETLLPDHLDRFPWAGHLGLAMLPKVVERLESADSTLIFTNTRSQAEAWFHALVRGRPDWLGEVALHHGSLDLEHRHRVEQMLRAGELRAVVCTSSLDLGVDFTPVDQVMQIGSPKGVARLMQRAGRSGHQPGAVSRVLGVPTNALEIVEFAAARDAVRQRTIESRVPPRLCLDVLVQHLVTVAASDGFEAGAMRAEVRSTHAFADLTDEQWSWCMDFVERGGAALTAYPEYARVRRADGRCVVESDALVRRHRMTIGTISSNASVQVAGANGRRYGTIEESFATRLRTGDRFVLAGRILELVRLRGLVATVRVARTRSGIVPRWNGGRSPLSTRLADALLARLEDARAGRFEEEVELVRPLLELQASVSSLPTRSDLLIERVRDRGNEHWFVFTFAGRLSNEGLGTLLAWRVTRRSPSTVTATANDYGIELCSDEPLPLDEDAWRAVLSTDRLLEDLLACLESADLSRRRFRDIARVAGLVFAGFPGQSKTARQLQASSDLFFDVFHDFDPGNLLLDQARREVLERELEFQRLEAALRLAAGRTMRLIHLDRLSPLSFPLWADRIRAQSISSESWRDRVQRMAVRLERASPGATRVARVGTASIEPRDGAHAR